jgi:hypothetical protein
VWTGSVHGTTSDLQKVDTARTRRCELQPNAREADHFAQGEDVTDLNFPGLEKQASLGNWAINGGVVRHESLGLPSPAAVCAGGNGEKL